MEGSNGELSMLLNDLLSNIQDVYEQELEYESCAVADCDGSVGVESALCTGDIQYTSKLKSIRELIAVENGDLFRRQDDGDALHSTTRLNVVASWHQLIEAMFEYEAFLEYVYSLESAFLSLAKLEERLYPIHKHLVDLLQHTVVNHDRDPSTETRFVTLLEVLRSYSRQWKPSEELHQLWFDLSPQFKVPANISPVDFRRGAYGVIVSLSWVPSSKGLLEACSIMSPDNNDNKIEKNIPEPVHRILGKIRNKPLPRNDNVYQILDRLKDETNVSVAITSSTYGEGGLGKTTLAALVASHPLIIKTFTVLWLSLKPNANSTNASINNNNNNNNINNNNKNKNNTKNNNKNKNNKNIKSNNNINNHNNNNHNTIHAGLRTSSSSQILTYTRYIQLLEILCKQLSFSPKWPEPYSMLRLEEPALKRKREEDEMFRAKQVMSDYLANTGRNILLVLDDTPDDDHIQWFRFIEKQSILVTSQSLRLSVDWTVDVDQWNEEEAIELFLLEAEFPKSHVIASADELRVIVRKCSNHPLTVRTVARWFKLKHVTAGAVDGLIESNGELTYTQVLQNVLKTALSPVIRSGGRSVLFNLCFLSMAAVFSDFAPVPLDSVLLLWQHLIKTDPDAANEIGPDVTTLGLQKRLWILLEGLTHLGLIVVTQTNGTSYVDIYHPMYRDFALAHIAEFSHYDSDDQSIVDDTLVMWNKAFVTCYLSRKTESNVDNCREYAMEKLVQHMIRAKLFQKAEALLSDGRLYQARVMAYGWIRGTELHTRDCMELHRQLKRNGNRNDSTFNQTQSLLVSVTDNMAQFLAHQAERQDLEVDGVVDISKALYYIGFFLAENSLYAEAISHYKEAQKLLPKHHAFNVTILYGLSSVYLAANEYEKALKKLSAGVKTLNVTEKKHIMYPGILRLQGEALIAYCHYKEACNHFDFVATQLKKDTFDCRIDYGILLYQKGRLHQVLGENQNAVSTFNECLNWKLRIGEQSRNFAAVYSTLGDIYMQSMTIKEARKYFEKALDMLHDLAETGENGGNSNNERDAFERDMQFLSGKVRYLRSDLPVDWTNYQSARKQILKAPIHLMDQSAYDLRCMAHAYEANDDLHSAMSLLEDALGLLRDRHDSLEKASCLLEMGGYLMEQNESMEALSCFENAVEIQILKLGECEQVLETLNLIGNVHSSMGGHEEALRIYGKVLELTDKLCGHDNEKIASALYAIGEAHEGLGQNAKAQSAFSNCLEVIKRDRRPDHPDVAKTLQRLGTVASSQGNLDKAYFYYTEALQIREANFGSHHVALAETLHGLGVLARKRSEYESAREFLADALSIWRQTNSIQETGETLLEIGNIHRLLRNLDHAIGCYLECLDIVESSTTEGTEANHSSNTYKSLLGSAYLAMGNTKLCLGRDSEAMDYCERALVIRKDVFGENHIKTANACRSLGILKYFTNTDGATRLLHDFVKIMDEHDNRGSRDYVIAMLMLGDIHKASGSRKLARQAWNVGKQVCDKMIDMRKRYPEIVKMLDHRILEERKPKASTSTPRRVSLFSRLQELGRLGEEELIARREVYHNPQETSILRQIVLLDD